MCSLKAAYTVDNDIGRLNKMVLEQAHPPLPDRFSDDLKNIYNQLMIKNPDERQRINEILTNPIIL